MSWLTGDWFRDGHEELSDGDYFYDLGPVVDQGGRVVFYPFVSSSRVDSGGEMIRGRPGHGDIMPSRRKCLRNELPPNPGPLR